MVADGTGGSAQQFIRGIDIDKLAKGFADEENVFKAFVTVSKTKAREMRWYQKTSGFIKPATTVGLTGNLIDNVAEKARPYVAEQTWTRNTSHIRKYMVESPWISIEDIKDNDVTMLATNVRDLTRGVDRRVDFRIYDIITEGQSPSNILSTNSVDGWDQINTANPILDILNGQQLVRAQGYNSKELILVMNSIEHKFLINWLITVKGSSIPEFSSAQLDKHVVMNILGNRVIVSENAPSDSVAQWIPNRSATWRSFMAMTAVVLDDPGLGKKIRVWEEGDCILTDPKSVHLIKDTIG